MLLEGGTWRRSTTPTSFSTLNHGSLRISLSLCLELVQKSAEQRDAGLGQLVLRDIHAAPGPAVGGTCRLAKWLWVKNRYPKWNPGK